MRTQIRSIGLIALLSILLASCRASAPADDFPPEQQASSSSETVVVPAEATYEGVLTQAGVSVYMEGTHRIDTPSGDVILLQSDTVDLDQYLDATVRVTGMARPTVEQGGIIMDVESVELLSSPVSSEAAPAPEPVVPVPVPATSSAAPAPVVHHASSASLRVSSTPSVVVPVASSSVAAAPATGQDRITAVMAKAAVDGGTFTQVFCTRHVGFCVPLHKSWFYNSFGATSSYLWHVEVSSEDVSNLGDGPLVINLVAGALDPSRDGTVEDRGNFVMGLRAWTNNRHFEVSAPSALRQAVAYISQNFTVYQPDDVSSAASSQASAGASASASSL